MCLSELVDANYFLETWSKLGRKSGKLFSWPFVLLKFWQLNFVYYFFSCTMGHWSVADLEIFRRGVFLSYLQPLEPIDLMFLFIVRRWSGDPAAWRKWKGNGQCSFSSNILFFFWLFVMFLDLYGGESNPNAWIMKWGMYSWFIWELVIGNILGLLCMGAS